MTQSDAPNTDAERWRSLMTSAQNGDRTAYAALLTELLPVIRRIVGRKWRNTNDAEDIVQEVLLSIHTARHTYDPNRPFIPWMMTITARRIADAARNSARRLKNETTVDVMPETFPDAETKTEAETSEMHETVRQGMEALTIDQRQAIDLLKVQGLSLKEASAISGKSVPSLKVLVHRATKAMQRAIGRKI
jgi:RNA polymerase sigma factor (sigma-70 family)